MLKQRGVESVASLVMAAIFVLIWGLFIFGWVDNIVKLFYANFDPLTGIVVLRIVGIFVAPLGAVIGYL